MVLPPAPVRLLDVDQTQVHPLVRVDLTLTVGLPTPKVRGPQAGNLFREISAGGRSSPLALRVERPQVSGIA